MRNSTPRSAHRKERKILARIHDFDGPYVNTLPTGLAIVKDLARAHDLHFDEEVERNLRRLWGLKGADLLEQSFGVDHTLAAQIYREWTDHKDNQSTPIVPGVPEELERFRERGGVNTILTSRPKWGLMPTLEHFGHTHLFDHIVTTCDAEYHKPDPRAFDCTMDMLAARGISPEQTVFIGDTFIDIQAGQARGVLTLIVRTGPYEFADPDEKYDFDPDHIIPSAAHVTERLKELGYS